ncbi:MAG TPA: NHL repeat-containing protein [Noviherbaspirillum sp.]|nr:NHL repeat-containing protein [Noviherbaspirillum sp.]
MIGIGQQYSSAWSRRIVAVFGILSGILIGSCISGSAWAQAAADTSASLVTPWSSLTGARVTTQPNPVFSRPPSAPLPGYLQWIAPTAVAARNSFFYVLDGGRQQIFRYDTMREVMTPFADYPASAVRAMAVAPDLSLYVADANARKVLHFAPDGRLLRSFADDLNLGLPVAVLFDEPTGRLLVADSLYNQVLIFNSLGQTVRALKSDETRSVEAMAAGPDGLYLVDRLGRQIVVIDRQGEDRYFFGEETLHDPNAIAVDRFNRVFVSDSFDNTIKVYEQGHMIATINGKGASPPFFNRVTGLWLEHDLLYVADSLNNRIRTFKIAPPGAKGSSRAE